MVAQLTVLRGRGAGLTTSESLRGSPPHPHPPRQQPVRLPSVSDFFHHEYSLPPSPPLSLFRLPKGLSSILKPRTTYLASMNTASSSRLCSCLTKAARSPHSVQLLAARRQKHTLPNLPYSIDSSLVPFLSTKALRGTAVEWHQGQLDRLNDLVRG